MMFVLGLTCRRHGLLQLHPWWRNEGLEEGTAVWPHSLPGVLTFGISYGEESMKEQCLGCAPALLQG
jgi:hypothetical protein